MKTYKLVAYPVTVTRTDQWLPRQITETVYMIEGPGVNRPATDIEIDVWKQGEAYGVTGMGMQVPKESRQLNETRRPNARKK